MDQVGPIHDRERISDIVVRNKDPYTPFLQSENDLLDFGYIDRVNSGKGLIHQDELRLGDEAAGNFEAPSFPATERVGLLLSERGEPEVRKLAFYEGFPLAPVQGERFRNGLNVLPNGEFSKYARFLGQIPDA